MRCHFVGIIMQASCHVFLGVAKCHKDSRSCGSNLFATSNRPSHLLNLYATLTRLLEHFCKFRRQCFVSAPQMNGAMHWLAKHKVFVRLCTQTRGGGSKCKYKSNSWMTVLDIFIERFCNRDM